MKLKYLGVYEYSKTKRFKKYQDADQNIYLEKATALTNYEILRQISDIAETSDHLLGIKGFYKKDPQTVNYLIPLLAGDTLETVINEQWPLSEHQIRQFIYQICLGLKELHANNILHRDIKPANIMLVDQQHIVLIDYDISREVKKAQTNDTLISGTHGFAAPEQYGFMQTDQRSDIYSLGKTIELLVRQCCPEQIYNFKHIIDACIELNPEQRFNNVDEIITIVARDYPTFFDEQLKQIHNGQALGLDGSAIEIYAQAKFNAIQMGVIKHALLEKVDQQVIALLADETFTSKQMWQIKKGYLDGLELGAIKKYAKPFYTPIEMGIYRTGILHQKNSKEINQMQKLYGELIVRFTFSDEQLKKIRYAIYETYDPVVVQLVAQEHLDVQQMHEILKKNLKENND